MLHTDNIKIEEIPFIHNYSDSGFMIEREDGKRFSDAKDLATENHTYVETDVPIEPESEQTETEQKAEVSNYLIENNNIKTQELNNKIIDIYNNIEN